MTNPENSITWSGDGAAEWAGHYGGRAAGDPAVSLVRFGFTDGAATYAAVRSSEAPEAVADWAARTGDTTAADMMPWDTLPGVQALAAADMRGRAPRSVVILGTVYDGEWISWELLPSFPPPPVPGAAAEGTGE